MMIPEKKHPLFYRFISLCNVLYKLILKVIDNRLKIFLPHLIYESHSAFMPGRQITANILIAYELIRFLKKKNKGKKGFMSIKLDMSKVYDSGVGLS